jgi:hypothetical protein
MHHGAVRQKLRILVAGLICSALGCSEGGENTAAVGMQPSAPIEVESAPRLCVGVTEGDPAQVFDRVVTPFVLQNGRLVVPLAGPGEIRVFDASGSHVTTLGRKGEGPGEFMSLQAAWARGDTIEAFDSRLLRITRFLPDGAGEVVTIAPIPSAQVAVPGSSSFGWVLTGVADAGMGRRDQVALHRIGRDGSHLGEVARFEGIARYQVGNFSGPDPLSPKTVYAAHGDRIYAGETLTPALDVFGPDGTLERRITWTPGTPSPADDAYETVINAAVAAAPADMAEYTRARLEAFPKASAVSVFWGVLVDDAGFVWIRPFDPIQHALVLGGYASPGKGGDWTVIAPDGVTSTPVTVPSQLEPWQITSTDMIGIHRDELGVESVCAHRVARQE